MKERIFLSWSKTPSKELAKIFSKWLPNVLQNCECFLSQDINVGAMSPINSILESLSEVKIGIIFVTPQNKKNPWLNFEAGAISKGLSDINVIPLLFGLTIAEIDGPLKQYQSVTFSKESVKKIIVAINDHMSNDFKVTSEQLNFAFESSYPSLEDKIQYQLNRTLLNNNPEYTQNQKWNIILKNISDMRRDLNSIQRYNDPYSTPPALTPDAMQKIYQNFKNIDVAINLNETERNSALLVKTLKSFKKQYQAIDSHAFKNDYDVAKLWNLYEMFLLCHK